MVKDSRALRVGIVGGGIGGLTLAHLLRLEDPSQTSIKVTVLERDAEGSTRSQGYYLGLNDESVAILSRFAERCEGLGAILREARNQYRAYQIRDGGGSLLFNIPGGGLFVDRRLLRAALLSGVEVVRGKRFVRYEEEERGGKRVVTAHFEGGSSLEFDILIGADGANSAVRGQRAPEMSYNDLGYTNVGGIAPLDAVPASIRHYFAQGLCRLLGSDGHALLLIGVYRLDGGPADFLWVLSYPGQMQDWEGRFSGVGEDRGDEYSDSTHARQQLLEAMAERVAPRFGETIAQVIKSSSDLKRLYGPRQIYSVDREQVLRLKRHPPTRVYLIGDCAHGTTTQRGLGANTAIKDAAELAEALLSSDREGLSLALDAWEGTMVDRGASVVATSVQTTQSLHATGFWQTQVIRPLLLPILSGAVQLGLWATRK